MKSAISLGLLALVTGSALSASAQSDRAQSPAKPTGKPLSPDRFSPVGTARKTNRHIIVFSKSARLPDRGVSLARRDNAARSLAVNLLETIRADEAQLGSLEVSTGALDIAIVAGLTPAQINRLSEDARVAFVEEDIMVEPLFDGLDPNPSSWGLDRIDQRQLPLSSSHEYSSSNTANIFIMDTGIDFSHPEFAGRVGTKVDFTGDTAPSCDNHGTHVAGTAAGATYGVARNVTVHDLKISHCSSAYLAASAFVNTINYVVNTNAPHSVINHSGSFSAYSNSMRQAVENAVASNVVYVTSAGNKYGQDACNFMPNNVADALTVAASEENDAHATYSNIGACVDLYAPGTNITSALRNGGSGVRNGTSMAAPHVAGIAASIWMDNPGWTSAQVVQEVISSATPNALTGVPSSSPNRLAYYTPPSVTPNQPPVPMVAINWSYVYSGRPGVTLDGSGSTDPESHTPLTYDWTELNHGLQLQDIVSPTFTAPVVTTPTTYFFDLKVTDSLGAVSTTQAGVAMVVVPDACTVYDQKRLLSEIPIAVMGSANADYTLSADLTKLEATIRDYVTDAQSQNAQVSGAILTLTLKDLGAGPIPNSGGTNIPSAPLQSASVNNGSFSTSSSIFWNGTPLDVDRWYRLHSDLRPTHNGGGMNNDCTHSSVIFRLPTYTGGPSVTRPAEIWDGKTQSVTTLSIGIQPIAQTTNIGQVSAGIGTSLSQEPGFPSTFRLRHKNTGQCLYPGSSNGGLVRHWACWADPNMVFQSGPAVLNGIQLQHVNSQTCIKAVPQDGGEVQASGCSGAATSFTLEPLGDGDYRLRHNATGKCLYATSDNGGKTHNWGCWADPNMVFTLEPA